LDFGSFIYIGEYSTACACRAVTPRSTASSNEADASADEQAAVAAGVAGAELQRRRIAQQQAQAVQAGVIGGGVGAVPR
jgi:hypothetical protein